MLQVIEHTDGRLWLRKDGKLILEAPKKKLLESVVITTVQEAIVPFTGKRRTVVALERQHASATAEIRSAMTKPIVIDHPQFVRPYQW